MFDNGDTLTLQQRENTVYDIAWHAGGNDNSKGPTTILSALQEETKDWSNVLMQVYTLGTTIFKDNAFTGCAYNGTTKILNCATNSYTSDKHSYRARMITVQEAQALGCTMNNQSCPLWMYNYLYNSTGYGGKYGNNWGYWTMNANSSGSTNAFRIFDYGRLNETHAVSEINHGARAVVMINKYVKF